MTEKNAFIVIYILMFILIYICIKLNMSSYYPQLLILYIVDPSDFHGLSVNSHSNSKKKKKTTKNKT